MRKRTILLLALGAVAALVVGWQVVALAGPVGTASGFEDDDANLVVNSTFDWNGFAPTTWTGTAPYRESSKVASGWTFKGIEDAQSTGTDTGFAGGTKQDQNCASVNGAKAPNKDDLKRIYLSTKNVGGNVYLNLAWVRIPLNTTSSSAHVGFEFNKGSTPCGAGSGGLVQRTAGDMLIVYDFEGGGGDPVLTLRRWVTSGACEISSNSPPCWGTATNLTAGGFAEAKVNTNSSVVDTISPAGSQTLGNAEFGEAGINLTAAGVFTAGQCETFGKAFGVSRSSGNSGTAQMKDLVGPGNFTLANCATVITRKVTDPSGDTTTNFGYTTNVTTSPATTTSPFSLKDGGSKTITNVNPGSSKNVTEDNPGTNYQLTSIDCSASTVPAGNRSTNTTTRAVTFSIAAGETLDCTFTNTKQLGALSILKKSTKTGNPLVSSAGAVFSYDGQSVTDNGANDEDPDIGQVCVSGLTPGPYSVDETSPPPGYGDASGGAQTATVVAGTNCGANPPSGSAEVTFTNPPLADIQVNFRDGGSGETSATIECAPSGGSALTPDSTTPPANWDTSGTFEDLDPGQYDCTVVIDP
jgi:hypothetical protein